MTTKISSEAAHAFLNNKNFKRDNTEVVVDADETRMYLHGNCIARGDDLMIKLRDCGWQTKTTKERLNAILKQCAWDVQIYQKNFEWFFQDEEGNVCEWNDGKMWNSFWTEKL